MDNKTKRNYNYYVTFITEKRQKLYEGEFSMNKKILSIIIAGALCFSIVGCGKGGNNTIDSENKNKTEQIQSNNESK